jgi:drug/metabolite transporter (DMT)-like permease
MLIMAAAAAGASICMTLCSMVNELKLPYYRLSGSAEIVMAAVLAIFILMNGELSRVRKHEWKWIVLRGAFGSATAIFAWAAVAEGAPVGDASSLGSVNVVVAALLGRAFLGEPLTCFHVLALVCSLVGAVLVSKPEAIMGTPNTNTNLSTAWFGHALALASGLSSGGLFIASRKSQGISPLIMSFSVSLQEGLSLWVVTSIGLVEDGPLEPLFETPAVGMGLFMAFFILLAGCVFTISLGSAMCPAAASSTIFTSVSMVLGYVAQSVIHHQHPDVFTKIGAGLMLLAVSLIAAARCWQSKVAAAREFEAPLLSEDNSNATEDSPEEGCKAIIDVSSVDSKTESLASFIALEFAGFSHPSKSIRQRRVIEAAIDTLRVTSV